MMLEIHCSSCHQYLITYQKDGPGPLLRCYWDRIHAPKEMCNLEEDSNQPDFFTCSHCHTLIGEKILYQKEHRLAFALAEGGVEAKDLFQV